MGTNNSGKLGATMINRLVWFPVLSTALVLAGASRGADVRIVKEGAGKEGVTLAGARPVGEMGQLFLATLQNDLTRSGWFRVEPSATAGIQVTGSVAGDQAAVRTALEVAWPKGRFAWSEQATGKAEARRLAHRLSDEMVRRILGQKGMAATRIVFIGKGDGSDLYCCDADGQSIMRITSDRVTCIGPKWDPTGQSVFYTSYLRGAPYIYRVPAAGGTRQKLANFNGLNTGGTVSPDGRLMALILSLPGNPELFIVNLASGALTRLTRTPQASEASPSWSPDGQSLVYVSDAAGGPQLYAIRADNKQPRRLTYRGSENVAPDWGSDGRIVYCTRQGSYQVAILDPASGEGRTVTSGPDHEDPSWAPDNRHIVCSRGSSGRRELVILDVPALDTPGDPPVRLFATVGDWTAPDWSRR